MSEKHQFYKYGSVTLSGIFIFFLITAITSQKTDQLKTKEPLTNQKKQSLLSQPKHKVYSAIVLPPPPPAPPEVNQLRTTSSLNPSSKQFSNAKKQVTSETQEHFKKKQRVLRPTLENNFNDAKGKRLKKQQETKSAKRKRDRNLHPKIANLETTKPIQIKVLSKGRVLLKKLEHGKGPQIEVSWPSKLSQKQKLYSVFIKCFGMKTAGLNSSNQLFQQKDTPNNPLKLNTDTSSGFIREVNGRISDAEVDETIRIKQKHSNQIFKRFVRIFPRQVDASLLQGLHSVLGSDFSKAKQIKASYRLVGKDVEIFDIFTETKTFSEFFQLRKSSQQC